MRSNTRYHKNMHAVWKAERSPHDGYRFISRATGQRLGHWGVYDRQRERFLSDDEVAKLSAKVLTEARMTN